MESKSALALSPQKDKESSTVLRRILDKLARAPRDDTRQYLRLLHTRSWLVDMELDLDYGGTRFPSTSIFQPYQFQSSHTDPTLTRIHEKAL